MDSKASTGLGPDAADPEYVVTLVHGTFAPGAAWTGDDSSLVQTLRHRLGSVTTRRFVWSGRNGHGARLRAGQDLAGFLRAGRSEFPQAKHVVIAHSHGGNVALYALRGAEDAGLIDGLVCFATPFLICQRREASGMLSVMVLAAPVAGLMALILGTVLLLIGARLYLLEKIGTLPEWALLLGGLWLFFLFRKLIFVVPGAAKRLAATRLPRWVDRQTSRIHARLRLPSIGALPVLVATYPRDEAALWLGFFDWLAAIPYRLWQGPASVLQKWRRFVMRYWLPGLVLIGIAGSVVIGWMGEERGGEYLYAAITAVLLPALQLPIQLGLVFLLLMVITPKLFRSHPLVFGWEGVFDNLFTSITPARVPEEATNLTVHEMPLPPRPRFKLRHSLVYEDDSVLAVVAEWVARVGRGGGAPIRGQAGPPTAPCSIDSSEAEGMKTG